MDNSIKKFTVTDTNICKGIAIFLMVLHHCVSYYYEEVNPSWFLENSNNIYMMILLFFSTSGKVCVSLLTLLSGYGLSEGYRNKKGEEYTIVQNIKYVVKRLIKFYSIYFGAVLFCLALRFTISGPFPSSVLEGIKIALIQLSIFFYSDVNWFVTAIIILYILFPLLYRLTKRFGIILVFVAYIPWIIHMFGPVFVDLNSATYYIYAFVFGIYASQISLPNRLLEKRSNKTIVLSIVMLIVTFVLRNILSLYVDLLFAVSIVYFEMMILSRTKIISKVLAFFGKNSANIWIMHGYDLGQILKYLPPLNYIMSFAFGFSFWLACSVILDKIKKVTKYDVLFRKINDKIKL